MDNGHVESIFRQTAALWGGFFTVPQLCTELSEDNDCLFKCNFENIFLSQKRTHHKRWLQSVQEETKVLSFARWVRYVHIWSWLLFLLLFSLFLLETFGFSVLLSALQVHICVLQFFPCLPRNQLVLQLYICYVDHAGWPLICSYLGWNLCVIIGLKKRILSARPAVSSIFSCISHRIPVWMELPLWTTKMWTHGFLIQVRKIGKV